jgi:hypothetical protein
LKSGINEIHNKKEEVQKPEILPKVNLVVDSEWRAFVPDK